MSGFRCALLRRLVGSALALLVLAPAAGAQSGFPFGQELILEERPLPGSKQRPILTVAADGTAEIDLWCRSGTGRVTVAGGRVTIEVGALAERRCTPQREQGDAELMADLVQVTGWRRADDIIELVGPRLLRFRPSMH